MEQNYLKKINNILLLFSYTILQAQTITQSIKYVFPYVAVAILFVVFLVNLGLFFRSKKAKILGIKYILITAITLSIVFAILFFFL